MDLIRDRVSEFRATIKSSENRVPKAYPIPKIGISKMHAPNGVATIRIEFACPSFVDHESILGRFLLQLKKTSADGFRQPVEVLPVTLDSTREKNTAEFNEQPAVMYLYSNGSGSFRFLRDTSSLQATSKFVFYKDEFLTQNEIDAVVSAYEEIYSHANVNAFFRRDLEQRRKSTIAGRGLNSAAASAAASDSKVSSLYVFVAVMRM